MEYFALSSRLLEQDARRETLWVSFAGMLLLVAWCWWAVTARVNLYAECADARLELDGATFPVEAAAAGRVLASHVHVGDEVHRGDILIEFDATAEVLDLKETLVRSEGLDAPLSRLRAQIEAESGLRSADALSTRSSQREAESRVQEAVAAARFADQDLERMKSLFSQGLISARDFDRAKSDAARLQMAAAAARAAAARVPQELASRDREHDLKTARLQGEIATLEAERDTLEADAARLRYEIDRHQIRASTDGRVGEVQSLQSGSVVAAGARLASIVPIGRLQVVANFPAQTALGRIRAGEPATLRLAGFPWQEFGTVSARVAHVAQVPRDGAIRVELSLDDDSRFRGPLAHGMPGTLEIPIERVSPLGLLLRGAGLWLTRPL
jgi:membrane fusion protein (multidrug efflux system)